MEQINILVVDDEKEIADLVEIYLVSDGYKVFKANNAKEGLEILDQEEIHLVLLDIMMPGMDGIEVLQKLRSSGDTTPVLLLTAKAQVEDRIHGLNEGADDYLPKPFDKGELVARIQVMVRRRKHYDKDYITVGNTKLDIEGLEITNTDHSLRLSGKEVEILSLFKKN